MELPPSSSAKPVLSQHDKPDNNHDAIKFWTQKEKFHLIQALKTYGRQDIDKVQKYVITKNLEETKAAIDYFSGIALHHSAFKKQKEKEKKLSEWEKLLKDNFISNELKTETATAVRLIADLEKIPARQVTEDIDFRQVYHQIANALEGKPMTPDLATCAVLHKCVTETAKACKAFIKTAEARSIINNIDLSDKQTNMFPKPTENQELAILRHLASQLSYNPLKVPEEHLKSSTPNFETPSTSYVQTTSTSYVETPSTSFVETPSTSNVETPSTSFVETPSTSFVETPSTSYVETPSTYVETTSTSYVETPSTSNVETPSTSYVETPSTYVETTSTSYVETPTTSNVETPSNSNVETPSTSNVETPSTSNDVLCTGVPNPGWMRNQSKGKKGESKGRKKGGFKAKGEREIE